MTYMMLLFVGKKLKGEKEFINLVWIKKGVMIQNARIVKWS